jgi:hypothetical protein
MVLDSLSLTHSLRAKNESAASFLAFTFDANSGLKADQRGGCPHASRIVMLRRKTDVDAYYFPKAGLPLANQVILQISRLTYYLAWAWLAS